MPEQLIPRIPKEAFRLSVHNDNLGRFINNDDRVRRGIEQRMDARPGLDGLRAET